MPSVALKETSDESIRRAPYITPEALTRPEAEYLARFKDVDSFTARLARAYGEAHPPEGVAEEEGKYLKDQAALFEEEEPGLELKPTEPAPRQTNRLS